MIETKMVENKELGVEGVREKGNARENRKINLVLYTKTTKRKGSSPG
jgi:hypothetical protein